MALKWDYTDLASKYDDRADYDGLLIAEVFNFHAHTSIPRILDMGAGTGKLTKELVKLNCDVIASEPNDEMRKLGKNNVNNSNCRWINSPGENIGVENKTIDSVWFGSSFNVIDHNVLGPELRRILKPRSWLTCLWNHRDLSDPIQQEVENIIKYEIKNYDYGTRRKDPSTDIDNLGFFGQVTKFESNFKNKMPSKSYVEAWKSHATLQRQCNSHEHFLELISKIEKLLENQENLEVPYTTRLWTSQAID